MRNLKKILALVLAMMMVLSMMVTANAAFEDADSIDGNYYEAVAVLSGLGVIDGVKNSDGTYNFNPKGILNRAQAAKIISYILTGDLGEVEAIADSVNNPFSDLPSWAEPYVLYAYNEGVVVGDGNGKYAPNRELTGYEFGKMLLVATGICDSDDFADSWKTVVASNLKKAGLWNGKDFALSAKLTREQACGMAYAALLYTEDQGSVWVVGNLKFSDLNTALLYCAVLGNGATPEEQPVNDGSLADTVFGLSPKYTDIDVSGRPYAYWVDGNDNLVAYIYDTPALTLNGPAYSTTLYTALGLRTGTTGTKVDGKNVYTNGVYGTDNDTVTIALNNYTDIIGNYGVTTEIYTNAKGVPTSIAQIVYTYGQVTNVTTGREQNGSTYTEYTITFGNNETVSGKVYTKALNKEKDNIDPAGAAKYDYVTFYVDASNFTHVIPVSYVNGTLTKSTSSGVYTIDGAEYVVATGVEGATAPSTYNQVRTYAIDQYGYILGDVTYTATTTSYLYVMAAEEISTLVNNKIVNSVVADVIFSDGTTGTVTVGSAKDANGSDVTDLTGLGGLYTYTVDKNGVYALKAETKTVTSINSTNPTIATGVVANANTKYIVANYTWSEKANNYVYDGTVNVLTGYTNVPTAVSGDSLVASYTLNKDGIADVVFVKSMTAANTTNVYAYYLGSTSTDGTNTYSDVIVDGEYTSVKNVTFTDAGLYKLEGTTATAVTFVNNNNKVKVEYKGGLLFVADAYNAAIAADVTVYVINSNTGAVETLTAADLATAVSGYTLIVNNANNAIATLYIVK